MKKYKLNTGEIIEGNIISTYPEPASKVMWKNWPALDRRYLDVVTFALTHGYSHIIAVSCHSGQYHWETIIYWDVTNYPVGTNIYRKQHEIQT